MTYDELSNKLKEAVNKMIEKDITKWESYVCKPSMFIKSKDSEYYADNKESADYQCEFIMKKQLPDGSWDINWRWEDYPEEWIISKNWWKGQVIIENLLYLKGFGLLMENE